MFRSRVSRTPDVQRIGQSLASPGMDPRVWVTTGFVTAYRNDADSEGPLADVVLIDGTEDTVRVGSLYAGPSYGEVVPVDVDDEVVIVYPMGEWDHGGVIVARMFSKSDAAPSESYSSQDRILKTRSGQRLLLLAPTLLIGNDLTVEQILSSKVQVDGQGVAPTSTNSQVTVDQTSTNASGLITINGIVGAFSADILYAGRGYPNFSRVKLDPTNQAAADNEVCSNDGSGNATTNIVLYVSGDKDRFTISNKTTIQSAKPCGGTYSYWVDGG